MKTQTRPKKVYMDINWNTETETDVDVIEVADTKTQEPATLIIYNDDVSTFATVIKSLIKYCRHTTEQAEQCAWLIHLKGKCDVKRGTVKELRPILEALLDRKLSAVIE